VTDYPDRPGSKGHDTSREAADTLHRSGRARQLRERVLDYYRRGNKATADECAEALGEDPWTIRPRVSELGNDGMLVRTGERRRNKSGAKAAEWRSANYQELKEAS
jgi:predicted HTH transcriptional regulator